MSEFRIITITIEESVNRQSYLLDFSGQFILFDPGSINHADILIENLKKHVDPKNIDFIILQSNDFLNITSLEKLFSLGFNGSIVANETGLPYLDTLFQEKVKTISDIDYHLDLKNGYVLEFLTTPFMPFPECFITYVKNKNILFSGHMFSQSKANNLNFESLIKSINDFHEVVLPSVEFIRQSINKIKKLSLKTIYPRLGNHISSEEINEIINQVLKYDFYNTQQVIEKKRAKNVAYNYENICNHMLKHLETRYEHQEILDVFSDSEIKLGLYPAIEIETTNLTGYKLWNAFFEIIYQKKGVEWLTILEPMVKKYSKVYNIKLPVIYKSKFIEQSKKIDTLSSENLKLENKVENLKLQAEEAADKLLRCPITKLYNQRFMMQYLLDNLDKEIDKFNTRGLIVVQIDNLLSINKKYGSNIGDETIRNLVQIINRIKSEDTILFKRNGPGIFIYKHNINEKMLTIFALKLSNKIKESDIFVEPITVSMGIVTVDELDQNYQLEGKVNQFVDLALMKLEKAKAKGKGEFVFKEENEKYFEGMILLVDEDETNQNMMIKIFERINYKVVIAKDIYRAYEILERHNIDIIISEINLSKLDGFQLKNKINQNPNLKRIPFIITSHHKNLEVITRANILDVDLILQKPIIPEELLGHIKRIRDKRVKV